MSRTQTHPGSMSASIHHATGRPSLARISLIIPGQTHGREWDPGKLPHSLKFPLTYLTLTGSRGREGSDRTGSGLRDLIWAEEIGATVEKLLGVMKKWSITDNRASFYNSL